MAVKQRKREKTKEIQYVLCLWVISTTLHCYSSENIACSHALLINVLECKIWGTLHCPTCSNIDILHTNFACWICCVTALTVFWNPRALNLSKLRVREEAYWRKYVWLDSVKVFKLQITLKSLYVKDDSHFVYGQRFWLRLSIFVKWNMHKCYTWKGKGEHLLNYIWQF